MERSPARRQLWGWAERELMENIEIGETTLITGPTGCGKTTLGRLAAEALGRPTEIFNYGAAFDAEASVSGFMRLQNGSTVFVPSRFVAAVRTKNMVVILDELSRAPVEVPNALLAVLDFQRRLVLDLETPRRRIVEVADGVTFVATANLGAGFVGSARLDQALLDRMLHIALTYPEPREEEQLLVSVGVSETQAREIVKKAGAVRAQYERGVLPETLSLRGTVRTAKLVANGNGIDESIERNMHLLEEESRAKLRATLKAVS